MRRAERTTAGGRLRPADSGKPAPFGTTGTGSGIGEELAGESDAGMLRCTTAPVTTGVEGGEGDETGAALGTGAGIVATEARSTVPAPA